MVGAPTAVEQRFQEYAGALSPYENSGRGWKILRGAAA